VRAIGNTSRPGDIVLDPFGGSGSTLIAAEQTARKAYLMKLDPIYVDVIVARSEKFSGRKAQRVTSKERTPAAGGRGRCEGWDLMACSTDELELAAIYLLEPRCRAAPLVAPERFSARSGCNSVGKTVGACRWGFLAALARSTSTAGQVR
jgi:hypothetical protein